MLKNLENRYKNKKQYLNSELMEQQNLFSKELLEYLKSLINLEISVVKDCNLSDNNLLFLSKIEFYKDIVFHNLKGRALVLLDNEFDKEVDTLDIIFSELDEEVDILDINISEFAQTKFSTLLNEYEVFSCIKLPEKFVVNLYDWKKDLEQDSHIEAFSQKRKDLEYYTTKILMEDYGLKEEDFSVTPSIGTSAHHEYITVPTIVDKGPNLRIVRNTKHY